MSLSVDAPTGAQTPRISRFPEGSSDTARELIDFAGSYGLNLDPWQRHVLEHSLRERAGDRWSASQVGVTVPRQNGKGALLEARELGGLFLLGEKLVIHTAHEFKDLDIDTPIKTTTGWSTMGDLSAGDEVYAPDGQPTKVLAAHPVLHTSDCYRVTFADGQSVVAGSGHLWAVTEVARSGRTERRVVTTAELRNAGLTHTWRRPQGRDRNVYRWRVDLPAPLDSPDADLPIDPYLLGMWLGDGTSCKGELTVGAEDLAHVMATLDGLDRAYRVRPDKRWPDRVFTVIVAGLHLELCDLGLIGAKSIPDLYLGGSISQRRALLAGIMDTDGTTSAHQIAVTMVNGDLMAQVACLVRSLGYRATLREFRARLNGCDAGPMHRVQFAPNGHSPFRLPRKSAKIRQLRTSRSAYNAVVAVDAVPTRPTRCITVAHESSCYLAGRGFVPTHNTAAEGFVRVKSYVDNYDHLRRRVKLIRTGAGTESIELLNGNRLRFVARSAGSGRGFSGDCVLLDEAYALTDAHMAALLPTLSARPNPQVWYTSSAGMAESTVLHRVRQRALEGQAERLAYFEWSAPDTAESDDVEAWAQANPALGIRINEEFVSSERGVMSDQDFRRERLGIWADDGTGQVIDLGHWATLADPESELVDPVVFALDMPWDRSSVTVAAGGRRADGVRHGEVMEQRTGTSWAVSYIRERASRWRPAVVLLDGNGPAASLAAELEQQLAEVGVSLLRAGGPEVAQACGSFYDAAMAGEFRHLGDSRLTASVAEARKSDRGDVWRWDRKDARSDISPLMAVTLAVHGAVAHGDSGGAPCLW